MPSGNLPPFARKVDPRAWAFFLDLDGTLIDLAPRPEDVVCPPALVATLEALEDAASGALAIVTGRSVDFAAGLLGTDAFTIAGLHGAQIRLGQRLGGGLIAAPSAADLGPAAAHARARAAQGLLFEHKGGAFALHFRRAPQLEPLAERLMAEALALAGAGFRLKRGKAVVELCPDSGDKGRAMCRLMRQPPFRGRPPLAAGDDLTDEAMFAVAEELGGLSIRIGAGGTGSRARHNLPGPQDFRDLLNRLAAPPPRAPACPERRQTSRGV